MDQNFENGSKFGKGFNILKMGQKFENVSKNLKMGQNFENE